MAETINGLYKAEVIHRRGPWRSFEAVEYATLEWVDWFNHRRLLEPIGRTLLYEAANVMLTRNKGERKLKDWAFAIAKRSTMRKARIALARRLAIIIHAMLRDGTEFQPA